MIDTTELRRLRDAAIEGPLVISAQYMQVMSATTEQFVSCEADNMNDPECLMICYAFNNAHAIADELDALRSASSARELELIDGIKHAIGCLLELQEHHPEDHEIAGVRHHLMGTITDDHGYAMKGKENICELDALRKRVAEAELLLSAIAHDGILSTEDTAEINEHLAKYPAFTAAPKGTP